jgi:hypothetical protein
VYHLGIVALGTTLSGARRQAGRPESCADWDCMSSMVASPCKTTRRTFSMISFKFYNIIKIIFENYKTL